MNSMTIAPLSPETFVIPRRRVSDNDLDVLRSYAGSRVNNQAFNGREPGCVRRDVDFSTDKNFVTVSVQYHDAPLSYLDLGDGVRVSHFRMYGGSDFTHLMKYLDSTLRATRLRT